MPQTREKKTIVSQHKSKKKRRNPIVLGIIPAREGSKGLPGKNSRLLAGKPLISYTIRAAQLSRFITNILVSTDDIKISHIAQKAGVEIPFMRPKKISGDRVSIWPVVRHAVQSWEASHHQVVETVVLLQPTSPLRSYQDIDNCIKRHRLQKADICVSVCRSHNSPYFNMVKLKNKKSFFATPCHSLMKQKHRRQDVPDVYFVNGGVYVIKRVKIDRIENQFKIKKYAIYEMPFERSIDIDSIDDLKIANYFMKKR